MPEANQLGHGLFERFANKAAGPETMVWKKTPPTITEFITSKQYLGQMPLSQRQAKALNDILGDDPLRTFENLELPIESILLWGKGCILGEEKLTLADRTERSIKELAEEGVAPVVVSLSEYGVVVRAQGSVPFLRGSGECLEVKTECGHTIRVFEEHLFLTSHPGARWSGRHWDHARNLVPGVFVACDGGFGVAWNRITSITPIAVYDYYDLHVEGTENYLAHGIFHHNSGRDLISSYIIAYLCLLVLYLRDPDEYLGLAHGENIDICNVATNASQSNGVFFEKLKQRLRAGCFKEFNPRIGKAIIKFEGINLRCHSLHAANESWEGLNILAWVMRSRQATRAGVPGVYKSSHARGAEVRAGNDASERVIVVRTAFSDP